MGRSTQEIAFATEKGLETMKPMISLFLFMIIVVGGGAAIGTVTAPGDWYAALEKPSFNPPNWIFGPVWTVLYLIIGYIGWRLWQRPDMAPLRPLWIVQLCLNFLWSPVFFAAEQPAIALAIILGLLLVIVHFIRVSWTHDRVCALLLIPYLAWVSFASVLNGAIVYLN